VPDFLPERLQDQLRHRKPELRAQGLSISRTEETQRGRAPMAFRSFLTAKQQSKKQFQKANRSNDSSV
jgi:hypothetical protein